LRGDLDGMLDTGGIAAGDLAGADGHGRKPITFVFSSPFWIYNTL
jgi:hypothetical protein